LRILYLSTLIESNVFGVDEELETLVSIPGQRFHHLMYSGLLNHGVKITLFSLSSRFEKYNEDDRLFRYSKSSFIAKIMFILKVLKNAIEFRKKHHDFIILVDILVLPFFWSAIILKLFFGISTVGIFTDIPEILNGRKRSNFMAWFVRRLSGGVFLSPNMITYYRFKKPFYYLDGMVEKEKNFVRGILPSPLSIILYSGNLNEQYGIALLVKAFLSANLNDYELHIYGGGDYQDTLRKLSNKHPSLKYFGVQSLPIILEAQAKAKFLINPRPLDSHYLHYSFPSKLYEYIGSGRPLITTKIPNIPIEIKNYLEYFTHDTIESFKETLMKVTQSNYEVFLKRAKLAKDFIDEHKNHLKQTRSVMELLKKI
jgi:hypothetical protein